jgi:hypothetical protein
MIPRPSRVPDVQESSQRASARPVVVPAVSSVRSTVGKNKGSDAKVAKRVAEVCPFYNVMQVWAVYRYF